MKIRSSRAALLAAVVLVLAAACSKKTEDTMADSADAAEEMSENIEQAAADEVVRDVKNVKVIEIAPGLTARILKQGDGQVAAAGDTVFVHYTGWLYDESAENNRGDKFDSSVDRGEQFDFPLGAGRVIKGWDQGVAGMAIGEVRELTIAPEMGYGERGAGNVIPPGATLVFEVELFDLQN